MNPFINFLSKLVNDIKLTTFAAIMSVLNMFLFYWAFFYFVADNVDFGTGFNGFVILASLLVVVLVANFFAYYLFLFLGRIVGKILLAISFVGNAIAIYFVNTYNVIIDESMIGNVFNTNYSEASGFFSAMFVFYVIVFGIVPCIYIFRTKINYGTWKRFSLTMLSTILLLLVVVFANANNWLWIDKHSNTLGGLVMPWSYSVNAVRYQLHEAQKNKKEILLPDATIKDNEKAVVVLVIGESARRQNFSLYGYEKETNPLLKATPNVVCFEANSCATYTTAAVKCILEHKESNDLYEILPNYLYRTGVDVVWRTTNWGNPPLHIEKVQSRTELAKLSATTDSNYDEVLLNGLKEQILSSDKNKVLVILHTSTSHGPQYSKKYPTEFERFTPVCNSVELANCSSQELMNAYDNTIVYTDYLLYCVIDTLSALSDFRSAMLFVSDHGESLGENNLYMHGVPMAMSPKEQYEIPFIVWTSNNSKLLKNTKIATQHHVFHSVTNFLSIDSSIYNEDLNLFE